MLILSQVFQKVRRDSNMNRDNERRFNSQLVYISKKERETDENWEKFLKTMEKNNIVASQGEYKHIIRSRL